MLLVDQKPLSYPSKNTCPETPQAIFQEQLQAEGSPKTLLVVAVHDHDSRGSNDARTREALLGDLEAVWEALPKADDKAEAELGDLFDVEVRFVGERGRGRVYACIRETI